MYREKNAFSKYLTYYFLDENMDIRYYVTRHRNSIKWL